MIRLIALHYFIVGSRLVKLNSYLDESYLYMPGQGNLQRFNSGEPAECLELAKRIFLDELIRTANVRNLQGYQFGRALKGSIEPYPPVLWMKTPFNVFYAHDRKTENEIIDRMITVSGLGTELYRHLLRSEQLIDGTV